jgi:acyl-coenzyme A synthetase/AMP-(fatty) acid ligase
MSYSYGLSVINSHLLKGATLVLTNSSFVLRDFWDTFRENRCTSFAGVPYSYQLLKKINFANIELPTLRTMTQAGGRLSEGFIKYFYNLSSEKGFDFYVMYGQTEATARISYVPKSMLVKKAGSIGIPIPGGIMKVYDGKKEIFSSDTEGELVYSGPNVMLGYADSRYKLSLGDELHGELHTGDLAKKDSDGYFYITGRMKRFIKIFGLRLNLDDVEKMVENNFNCAAACFGSDEHLKILLTPDNPDLAVKVSHFISEKYKIHHTALTVQTADSIPTTQFGKKDYKALEGSAFIA